MPTVLNNPLSTADLMARIARDLKERAADNHALRDLLGNAPEAFEKPPYGTPQYILALRCGWISPDDELADRAAWELRRRTALQTCHRYSLYERARAAPPKETGAYVPELSSRI